MSEGLSVKQDLFAVRLLELARLREPEGNRVRFVKACESHGIRGFLQQFREIWQTITDDPPRDGIESDRNFAIGSAGFSLKAAAFQQEVLQVLEEANIRALAIKGVSLALLVYGDLTERQFGDVDIWVPEEQAQRAVAACHQYGLSTINPIGLSPTQELAHFRFSKARTMSGKGCSLDLHWRSLSAWVGYDLLKFDDCWERSQELTREGLQPWRTLGNADTIAFLALHGSQDGWPSLKQLLDLSVALENLDYSWPEVLSVAGYRAVLVERAVELCVRLMGIPHPAELTHHFRDSEHALNEWLRQSTADKSPQFRLLGPELWSCHSSEALARAFRNLLNPANDDIASVELPRRWHSLYPLVRVFRLLMKSWQRR